jgi:hypothetical protein
MLPLSGCASSPSKTRRASTTSNGPDLGDFDQDDITHEPGHNDADNDDGRPSSNDSSGRATVLDFGKPSSQQDLTSVEALLKLYYERAAADDGAGVCRLLTPTLVGGVVEDLGHAPGPPELRGNTCGAVLTKVYRTNQAALEEYVPLLKVRRLGVKGNQAIAVLDFPGHPTRDIGVEKLHGKWYLEAPADQELP